MQDIKMLYDKIEDLRKQVKSDSKSMNIYNHLKDKNTGDALYGWMFDSDAILTDTLEDLDLYQPSYIRDVLSVYKGELETILYLKEL